MTIWVSSFQNVFQVIRAAVWVETLALHAASTYCMGLAVTLPGKGLALSPRAQHGEVMVTLDCGIPSTASTQADSKGNRKVTTSTVGVTGVVREVPIKPH